MNGHAARLRIARKREDGRRRRQRGFPGLASSVHHLLVVGLGSLWRSSALCASRARPATLRPRFRFERPAPPMTTPVSRFLLLAVLAAALAACGSKGGQPRHGQRAHGGWWCERHLGRQLPERGRELPRSAVGERPRRAVARRCHLHADVLQGRRGGDDGGGRRRARSSRRSSRTASSTSAATRRSTRARRRRRSRRSS